MIRSHLSSISCQTTMAAGSEDKEKKCDVCENNALAVWTPCPVCNPYGELSSDHESEAVKEGAEAAPESAAADPAAGASLSWGPRIPALHGRRETKSVSDALKHCDCAPSSVQNHISSTTTIWLSPPPSIISKWRGLRGLACP